MAANCALTKDHQVARKDIGPLHGDKDRRTLPGAGQVVVGPMTIPLPPCTSMAWLMHSRPRSVRWYLRMAESTEGFSPRSTALAVRMRALSISQALPPIRARAS